MVIGWIVLLIWPAWLGKVSGPIFLLVWVEATPDDPVFVERSSIVFCGT